MEKNIEIYTDGSHDQSNRCGGWAFLLVPHGDKIADRKPLISKSGNSNYTTIVRMELTAILESLKCIEQHIDTLKNSRILIYTDSEISIKCIQMNSATSNKDLIIPIQNLLSELRKQIPVDLKHIYSHSGIHFNDEVDKLARQAMYLLSYTTTRQKEDARWLLKQQLQL